MSDIFICYSRSDSTVASRLAERLRVEGWSVFMDVQTHVGKRWHKEIEKELHGAKAVVVLWSARSRDSDFAGRSPARQTQGDPLPCVHRARGISLWI